jgi:hypothetical protein
MIEAFISVFTLLGFWLLRVDPKVVLLLTLGLASISGCMTPTVKEELELTTHDPTQDHRKIAAYYNHEAAKLRQASEEMSVRITVYERLFGPTSDWANGARLLTQSYEDAATEHERKAREHLELINPPQPRSEAPVNLHQTKRRSSVE